ncbi:MAG: translational GTPase TypA [bacterium]
MQQDKLRNVAIIAHVDHGKTTLVDQLFKQSGSFRDNQAVEERLMDSMDLEKERGITIRSKNGACVYKDHFINIIDTPGHADFGGEVERVLKMADGALFLVDAQEGPMPQSYFVLKKAIALHLPVIVVVNKIDKENARPDWVIDQVFDLMVKLNAPDELLDFKVIYASAKAGIASVSLDSPGQDMFPVLDSVIESIPAPSGDVSAPFKVLINSIAYDNFLGRLAIGKIYQGQVSVNQEIVMSNEETVSAKSRISKIYQFKLDAFEEIPTAIPGQIVALAGLSDIKIGDTICAPDDTSPLKGVVIDPPTLSMQFLANDSPFSGQDGEFVTGSQVKERLQKETLSDPALHISDLQSETGTMVSGRGELHLSILIEKMRREGYEFQVSRPRVIIKDIDGKKQEPYEEVTIDIPEETMGAVIESLGHRKGVMQDMLQTGSQVQLRYHIPTRGLLGYQSEFMTLSKGLGTIYSRFLEYRDYVGAFKTRLRGVLISKEACKTLAFALFNLQQRGSLFMGPGTDVYEGQIIGESSREEDMVVNPGKGKKLTNMRASGSDETIILTPPKLLSLEQCMSFIDDSELLECTPKEIRIRKRLLSESLRKQHKV